jgi:hypothetical protein
MTTGQAHDLLTGDSDHPPRSVYRECSTCAALVARQDIEAHRQWHDALAVLAARVLGLAPPSD